MKDDFTISLTTQTEKSFPVLPFLWVAELLQNQNQN